jgi:hypothetical protein
MWALLQILISLRFWLLPAADVEEAVDLVVTADMVWSSFIIQNESGN